MSMRLNILSKKEGNLFKDTDDLTRKDKNSVVGDVSKLDKSLKPLDDKLNWRKLTNVAEMY
jgi:hypothetical protein